MFVFFSTIVLSACAFFVHAVAAPEIKLTHIKARRCVRMFRNFTGFTTGYDKVYYTRAGNCVSFVSIPLRQQTLPHDLSTMISDAR